MAISDPENVMKILIVGGTGLIGYHAMQECLRHGHKVTVLALPPLPDNNLLPPEVGMVLADMNRLSDEGLLDLLKKQDAVVFAAGADDRTLPRAPAYPFFYEANVKSCVRLFSLARRAGVKRGVILGSYFAHFDRIRPELKLSHYHPYIRSRQEQEKQALAEATQGLELMILELPYIFGSMPGRMPLWKPLIDYIRSPFPLFYTRGGTNMISVKHVAEAVAGALELGEGGQRYLIGDENVPWTDLLKRLSRFMGRRKKVILLPSSILYGPAWAGRLVHKIQGKESGLHPARYLRIQTVDTFFDPEPSRKLLGYGRGGLDQALQDTVKACQPNL
jgi:dihydroflavonol-4-reductase